MSKIFQCKLIQQNHDDHNAINSVSAKYQRQKAASKPIAPIAMEDMFSPRPTNQHITQMPNNSDGGKKYKIFQFFYV